jgi:hypothetical protein
MIKCNDLSFGDREGRARCKIKIVFKRYDRIQPIISSSQLEDDKDWMILSGHGLNRRIGGLGIQGYKGSLKKNGYRPTQGGTQQGGAQEVPSG